MPKTLDECKASHGPDLGTIDIAGTTFVFGNPSRDAWRKFRASQTALAASEANEQANLYAGRAEHALESLEELAKSACVSHNPAELEAAADIYYDTLAELGECVRGRFEGKQAALGKASATPGAKP